MATVVRNFIVLLLCVSLSGLAWSTAAVAGVIGTDDYLSVQERGERIDRVQAALREERISQQLTALGVNPEQASARVAALPNADLVALDERLEELPAGAGALELVLVVFLVLLILDLTGLTNIFPGIGPGQVR